MGGPSLSEVFYEVLGQVVPHPQQKRLAQRRLGFCDDLGQRVGEAAARAVQPPVEGAALALVQQGRLGEGDHRAYALAGQVRRIVEVLEGRRSGKHSLQQQPVPVAYMVPDAKRCELGGRPQGDQHVAGCVYPAFRLLALVDGQTEPGGGAGGLRVGDHDAL